jgi:hypothetical protein
MPNAGIPAFEHSNPVKMPEFPDLNTQMPEFPDLNKQMPEFPDLNKRIANLDMSESLEEL